MKKHKKLAQFNEVGIICHSPFSESVITERDKEYQDLTDIEFRKKYRQYLFAPAVIEFPNDKYEIQMNSCNDPFCAWYGLKQKTYENVKFKPSRYKMVGTSSNTEEPAIFCNDIPSASMFRPVLKHNSQTISNWSIAEEIKRLVTINTVLPVEPEYDFHNSECKYSDKNPFNDANCFRKRGKSTGNSIKYQCKACEKITNVLPEQDESFNYHQKRNDILIKLCDLIFSRTPVKRICETLEIGSYTFYSKLDWLYRKCLEFNERYEAQAFKAKSFSSVWINTDMMIYNLNNIRLKGKGGKKALGAVEKKPQTYIVCSTDLKTGYAFRCDVAYDSNVTLEQVEADTRQYHCDHSYAFLRKNDRLRHSYCPQSPTPLDSQSMMEYLSDMAKFNNRKEYVEGCHVKPQYTAMAHYILLSRQLNAK